MSRLRHPDQQRHLDRVDIQWNEVIFKATLVISLGKDGGASTHRQVRQGVY